MSTTKISVLFLISALHFCTFVNGEETTSQPKQKFILLPIGYYTPETSAALGALAIYNISKQSEGRISNVLATASYTFKKQSIFIVDPKLYVSPNVELFGSLKYLFFPAEFYGRGNETKRDDKENFTQNIFTVDAGVKHKFHDHYFFAPIGSYQKQKIVEFETGKKVETEMLTGYGEYKQQSLGMEFGYDSRDFPNAPLSGIYYFATISQHWFEYPYGFQEDQNYKNYELNLRHYHSMGEKKVLAANLFLAKEEGKSIPFQFLNKLGGNNALRGYLSGRYRDKAMSILQLDYRCDFTEKFSYSIFGGLGTVASNTADLLENRRRHAAGAGIHYIADSESRQKFRFDIGFGEEDWGIYVIFGEAF